MNEKGHIIQIKNIMKKYSKEKIQKLFSSFFTFVEFMGNEINQQQKPIVRYTN